MAITMTLMTEGSSTTDASSYVTAAFNPDSNKLYLVVVANGNTGGASTAPTLSGGGLSTWVEVESNQQGTGNQRITLFRGMSSGAGGLEALTIDFGGVTQHNCIWKVIEFNGVITGVGSNGGLAVIESVQGDDSGATNTVSLSGVTAGNATFGCLTGNSSSVTYTPDTGFVSIGTDVTLGSPALNCAVVWSVGGTNPISINSDTTPITALIGVELAAAGVSHALAGVINGSATAAGALTNTKHLAGEAAGTATTNGALRYAASLAGVTAGVSTVHGGFSDTQSLAGVAASASTVTGTLRVVSSTALYLFTPPTAFTGAQITNDPIERPIGQKIEDWKIARRLFSHYGPREVGRSVLKINGTYITVDTPSQALIAAATEVYLGGHRYIVDATVSEALVAAGFDTEVMP